MRNHLTEESDQCHHGPMPSTATPTTTPIVAPRESGEIGQTLDFGSCPCCGAGSGERCERGCRSRFDDFETA